MIRHVKTLSVFGLLDFVEFCLVRTRACVRAYACVRVRTRAYACVCVYTCVRACAYVRKSFKQKNKKNFLKKVKKGLYLDLKRWYYIPVPKRGRAKCPNSTFVSNLKNLKKSKKSVDMVEKDVIRYSRSRERLQKRI